MNRNLLLLTCGTLSFSYQLWAQNQNSNSHFSLNGNNPPSNNPSNFSNNFGTPSNGNPLNIPAPPAPEIQSTKKTIYPLSKNLNSTESLQKNNLGFSSNSSILPKASLNKKTIDNDLPSLEKSSLVISSESLPNQNQVHQSNYTKNVQIESESKKSFLNPSLQEFTSVRYNDAPLQDVLGALAISAQINIVLSSKIEKDELVNLRLNNVTYETVIKTILNTLELDYIIENGIMRILLRSDIMKEKSEKDERNKLSKKIEAKKILIRHIKHALANDIMQVLSSMINDVNLNKNSLTNDLDKTSSGTFKIEYDKRTNSLLIQGTQDELSLANEIINKLDKKKPQILIEARIVEASNDLAKTLGISWGTRFGLDGQRGFNTGLVFPSSIRGSLGGAGTLGAAAPVFDKSSAPQFGSFNFSLGSLNGLLNLDGILKAYEKENMANVIASPRIVVQDQEKATIGDNTSSQSAPSSNSGTQAAETTRSFGVTLDVTPQVASEDQIALTLSVNRTSPATGGTSSKTATTKLVVKNGETTVIGGLFQTSRIRNQGRIPVLGKLPLIGFLFRNTSDEWLRTELLIMITPRIQGGTEESPISTNAASSFGNNSSAHSVENPNSALNNSSNAETNTNASLNTGQNSTVSSNSNSYNSKNGVKDSKNGSSTENPLNNTGLNNGGLNSNGF